MVRYRRANVKNTVSSLANSKRALVRNLFICFGATGVTDDGYVRGVRLDRNERDDLKKAIDAALRPIEKHGMIVGPEPR